MKEELQQTRGHHRHLHRSALGMVAGELWVALSAPSQVTEFFGIIKWSPVSQPDSQKMYRCRGRGLIAMRHHPHTAKRGGSRPARLSSWTVNVEVLAMPTHPRLWEEATLREKKVSYEWFQTPRMRDLLMPPKIGSSPYYRCHKHGVQERRVDRQ